MKIDIKFITSSSDTQISNEKIHKKANKESFQKIVCMRKNWSYKDKIVRTKTSHTDSNITIQKKQE